MRPLSHAVALILALAALRMWYLGNVYTTQQMAVMACAVAVNLLMYALSALDSAP